jgi:hypothetical protein
MKSATTTMKTTANVGLKRKFFFVFSRNFAKAHAKLKKGSAKKLKFCQNFSLKYKVQSHKIYLLNITVIK